MPEVEPDRDELLLHAVVQVAFDPAPFAGDGVEDVLALRGERRDATLGGGQPVGPEEPARDLDLEPSDEHDQSRRRTERERGDRPRRRCRRTG